MNMLEQIRSKNPSLRNRSDDEIKEIIRPSPEFNGLNTDQFNSMVTGAWGEKTEDKGTPGFFDGLSAGVDQVQGMGGGLIQAAGAALESDALWDFGKDMYQRNMAEAGENSLDYGFTDIRGAGDAFNWARYTAGNLLPTLAVSLAGGGVGGLAGRALAGAAAKQSAIKAGQGIGAMLASSGMETGAIMGETETLDVALAHGVLAGSFDSLLPFQLLRRAGAGKVADEAADEIGSSVLRSLRATANRSGRKAAGRGAALGLIAEAPTEGLQGLIGQHANYWVENNGESLLANLGETDWKAVIDEAAAGGLMGSGIGAPTGLIERGQAKSQVARIDEARLAAEREGGDALDQLRAAQEAERRSQSEIPPPQPGDMPDDFSTPYDIPPLPPGLQEQDRSGAEVVLEQDGIAIILENGRYRATRGNESVDLPGMGQGIGDARRKLDEQSAQPPAPAAGPAENGLTEKGTGVYRVPVDQLQVDPEQYQFRSRVNQSGVDNRLDSVEQWDENRAGDILAHRRADGSLYVADGHHRLDLAKRLGQKDVNVRILEESDGFDVKSARVEAAMANIADGKAEPLDIAKVFRDIDAPNSEIRKRHNLPNKQVTLDGEALANLSDNAFGMVVAGQMSEKDGAAIGASFTEQSQQEAAARAFQNTSPKTAFERQLLVNEIKAAGFAETQGDQGGLFGDDPTEISLLQKRLSVLDSLRQALAFDKKLFGSLNKNAGRAGEAGNQIATEANKDITEESAKALDLINRVSTTPALNDMVNRAARRLVDGEKKASVVRDLKTELLAYEQANNQPGAVGPGRSGSTPVPGQQPAQSEGLDSEAGERVPGPNADGADQGGESQGARGDVTPTLDLETQTEGELSRRERTRQQAEKAQADQKRKNEQREQADAEAGDFTLSGSDSAVDKAEARGQGNMFDAPAESTTDQANQPADLSIEEREPMEGLPNERPVYVTEQINGEPVEVLWANVSRPRNGIGERLQWHPLVNLGIDLARAESYLRVYDVRAKATDPEAVMAQAVEFARENNLDAILYSDEAVIKDRSQKVGDEALKRLGFQKMSGNQYGMRLPGAPVKPEIDPDLISSAITFYAGAPASQLIDAVRLEWTRSERADWMTGKANGKPFGTKGAASVVARKRTKETGKPHAAVEVKKLPIDMSATNKDLDNGPQNLLSGESVFMVVELPPKPELREATESLFGRVRQGQGTTLDLNDVFYPEGKAEPAAATGSKAATVEDLAGITDLDERTAAVVDMPEGARLKIEGDTWLKRNDSWEIPDSLRSFGRSNAEIAATFEKAEPAPAPDTGNSDGLDGIGKVGRMSADKNLPRTAPSYLTDEQASAWLKGYDSKNGGQAESKPDQPAPPKALNDQLAAATESELGALFDELAAEENPTEPTADPEPGQDPTSQRPERKARAEKTDEQKAQEREQRQRSTVKKNRNSFELTRANGQKFKSRSGAADMLKRWNLQNTHYIYGKKGEGFTLRQLPAIGLDNARSVGWFGDGQDFYLYGFNPDNLEVISAWVDGTPANFKDAMDGGEGGQVDASASLTKPEPGQKVIKVSSPDKAMTRLKAAGMAPNARLPYLDDAHPDIAPDNRSAGEIARSFGGNLTSAGVEALDALATLFGGPGRMGSGLQFDEDTYARAKPHFKKVLEDSLAAGDDLKAFIRKIIQFLGLGSKPYLVRFVEDYQADMAAAESKVDLDDTTEGTAGADSQDGVTPSGTTLADRLLPQLDQITDNRKLKNAVAEFYGVKAADVTEQQMKAGQEAMEFALVQKARGITQVGGTDAQVYAQLLALYRNQPNLDVRSSGSIQRQAYSTPAPLAFLSSRLAGITEATTVYEPTAGNGMLLIGAPTDNVIANELDPERATLLENQGIEATREDATTYVPADQVDSVIMNPPFGRLKDDDGKAKPVKVDGYTIKAIDHLIAAKALSAMRDDGQATMIIGASKAAGEIGAADRTFFNWLYRTYNVTSHFEVDGDLYSRQGAGWPVRVITINGRRASSRISPKSGVIERAMTWSEVYEQYERGLDAQKSDAGRADGAGRTDQPNTKDGSVLTEDSRGEQDRSTGEGSDGRGGSRNSGNGSRAGRSNRTDDGDATDGRGGVTRGEPGQSDIRRGPDQSTNPAPASVAAVEGANTGKLGVASTAADADPVNKSEFQTPYKARSTGKNDNVLTPNNMALALQEALDRLEAEVGNLDTYVQEKLGYDTVAEMHESFMGLQVDAVAASIYNIDNNAGIIIADQTGVGKGRQAAAIIRYARRSGKTPIFMSVGTNLFSDMYGDLKDIGEHDAKPFIVNTGEKVAYKGKDLFQSDKSAKNQRMKLEAMAASGQMPEGTDTLFLTYSQVQTDNVQRKMLRAMSENAVFILDEAHNISGNRSTMIPQSKGGGERLTGAGFMFDIIKDKPVMYLSATFAKRPDNLPIYYRTDLSQAVDDIDQIDTALSAGGLPLQSVIANMLAQAGQLFRRERSFDGIKINTFIDTDNTLAHEKLADTVAKGLSAINLADKMFHGVAMEGIKEAAESQGGSATGAGNRAGNVDHTNFSSVIHNYIGQLLLGLKVETAASQAVALHKRGIKPVIGLESTMGSFLSEYVDDMGLEVGDPVDASFVDVLLRALERSRRYSRTLPNGDKEAVQVTLAELDLATRETYLDAQRQIESLDISDLPMSPIDLMRYRMEQGGMQVSEITGRDLMLDYSTTPPTLARRDKEEKTNKRGSVDKFNDGRLDGMIINVSGSTGLSIHASEKFKDQKPRHMIVAQAPKDINVLMQMLGRINRTGQVELPEFTMLGLNIPAEKRPLATTAKKMKSLNANTSANDKSDTSVNAPDILNKYGDQVVVEYLQNNPELAADLDLFTPGQDADSDAEARPDIALKFTGRLARTPVAVQKAAYEEIEASYAQLMDYLNKTGQNDLEPQTIDLDAKILESKVVYQGKDPGTIFGGNTTLHKVDAHYQGKPPTGKDVRKEVDKALKGTTADAIAEELLAELAQSPSRQGLIDKAKKRFDDAEAAIQNEAQADGLAGGTAAEILKQAGMTDDRALSKKYLLMDDKLADTGFKYKMTQGRLEDSRTRTIDALSETFKVGDMVMLDLKEETVTGIVTGIKTNPKGSGDPYALSKTRVSFMVNSGVRNIELPLSKLKLTTGIYIQKVNKSGGIEAVFDTQDLAGENRRENRFVVTGNLIAAAADPLIRGRIVSFTGRDGDTHQGMLMPRYFNDETFDVAGSGQYLTLRDPAALQKFLKNNADALRRAGGVFDKEQIIRLIPKADGRWSVFVPRANKDKLAQRVKFNQPLIDAMGMEFFGRGKMMEASFDANRLSKVASALAELTPLNASPSLREAWVRSGGEGQPQAVSSFDERAGAKPDAKAGNTPAFMRTSGATGRGLSEARVQATVDEFLKAYPGADNVKIKIHRSATTLPGFDAARDGRSVTIAGEYVSQTDTVHLVSSSFRNEGEVLAALREEVLVHKGLGYFASSDRQQLYIDIQAAAQENAEVKALWEKTVSEYQPVAEAAELSEEQANRLYAEEMLGTLAQERPNWMKKGWRKLWRGLKRLLVNAGWIEPSIGTLELRAKIDLIANAFQKGTRVRRRDFNADIRGVDSQDPSVPAFGRAGKKDAGEFKQWFKGSQITDESGGPLRVYHGTNAEFTEFSRESKGSNTAWENTNLGFYFIADQALAKEFAEQSGGDTVMDAYLAIKQPLRITNQDLFTNREQAATVYEAMTGERLSKAKALDALNEEIGLGDMADAMNSLATDDAKAIMERDGYDGVISDYGDGTLEYVAFNPDQVRLAEDRPAAFSLKSRSTDGLTREQWREANKVSQRQAREPHVQKAAQQLADGEISQDQYLDAVRSYNPIRPLREVPAFPTVEQVAYALDEGKLKKGIVGLDTEIEPGTRVGLRLDIPAYDFYDTWVVSVHDGKVKNGKSLAYAQTGMITDVEFKGMPKATLKIATGESSKAPVARMHGNWEAHDPDSLRAMADVLIDDPQWSQIGQNPFRHSWFYDKADGQPVTNAEHVIQIGPLVLAKNVTKTNPSDDIFLIDRDSDVRFSAFTGKDGAALLRSDLSKAVSGVPELAGAKVIESTDQLPKKARDEIRAKGLDPARVRGLYVDGELYVVAGNIETSQDGIRVAVHEAVGHKGIRAVLGESLDTVMLQLYRSLPNTPEGRAALDEVKREYTFLDATKREDRIQIAEEMVAHLLEKGHRPKAWQRAVAKVRALLRRLIPSIAWTNSDVLSLGEQSRQYLRQRKAGTGDAALRFSIGSRGRSSGSPFADFNDADKAADAKIGPRSAPRRVMDAWREMTDRAGLKIRQGMVDRLAAFKAQDEKLLGEGMLNEDIARSSWVLGRMANAANGALHAMMHTGRIMLDPTQKVLTLKEDESKGLGSVFAQLASHGDPDSASAEVKRFMGWIAGNRARKLQDQGRENLFTDDDITAMESWDRGTLPDGRNRAETYADVFEQFQAYRDDVLAIAEKAGLLRKGMSPDDAVLAIAKKHGIRDDLVKKAKKARKDVKRAGDAEIREMAEERESAAIGELQQALVAEMGMAEHDAEFDELTTDQRELWGNEFYVPFYRINEDEKKPSGQLATGGLSRQQAYKRLKGGTQNLNDLLENTMMNFHHLLDASLKNQAAQQAVENASLLGMARKVPAGRRDLKTSTFVLEEGEQVYYQIDDPLVFEALTALSQAGMNNMAMKVMRGFKRLFTQMTTSTPQFMVANLIRDTLQASATSDVSKNVLANVIGGTRSYRDLKNRAQMMASGASFNFGHIYGSNPDELRAQLTRDMRGARLIDSPKAVPDALVKGWTWWTDVNNAAENINRAAIFTQNQDKGKLKAAFESRDLIDFSAHGAWPAIRILIDIVPFLNARIQGLDKIYRSGVKPGASVLKSVFGGDEAGVTDKQSAGRFWAVTGVLAVATMALFLHNYDDEEYKKLEDWQKDSYWFFRFGDQAFFIPKPFEVGAISTMVERITEQFVDDKATGKLFRERMWHMLTDTFSFSPIPQAVQPVLDIYANYDAFTQRPIEGMGMDRLSPELRKRASTSKAGEWISQGLNATVGALGNAETNPLALSPVQVDHLIGGYLGQVGSWVAGSGDVAWRVATGNEKPAQRWYEYQPVRRFYGNLGDEDRYTKYGTVFYEGLREAGRAFADVKEMREMGNLADAAAAAKDKQAILQLRTPLNRAQSRLREINRRIDVIRRSDMDGELKRQQIDRMRAVKNRIQRALGERVMEARAK